MIAEARQRGIEGTITVPDSAAFDENAEPIRHGPFLLIPYGWEGPERDEYQPSDNLAPPGPSALTTEDARKSPLWREPGYIPSHYQFDRADSDQINQNLRLLYKSPRDLLEIQIWHPQAFPVIIWYSTTYGGNVTEPSELGGMPAILIYDPTGELEGLGISVLAYDETENYVYVVQISETIDIEAASKILLSLRQP